MQGVISRDIETVSQYSTLILLCIIIFYGCVLVSLYICPQDSQLEFIQSDFTGAGLTALFQQYWSFPFVVALEPSAGLIISGAACGEVLCVLLKGDGNSTQVASQRGRSNHKVKRFGEET